MLYSDIVILKKSDCILYCSRFCNLTPQWCSRYDSKFVPSMEHSRTFVSVFIFSIHNSIPHLELEIKSHSCWHCARKLYLARRIAQEPYRTFLSYSTFFTSRVLPCMVRTLYRYIPMPLPSYPLYKECRSAEYIENTPGFMLSAWVNVVNENITSADVKVIPAIVNLYSCRSVRYSPFSSIKWYYRTANFARFRLF